MTIPQEKLKVLLLRAIIVILVGGLALGGLIACSNNAPSNTDSSAGQNKDQPDDATSGQKTAVAKGSTAPDFSFTTIDGQTKKLSDYEGRIVLLNFWATWCGYCIDEMPAMQEITEDYADVVVLAINRGDSATEATLFSEENPYDFVWGLDEDGAIQSLYPSNGIPYSVIIDKQGTIVELFEGSAPNMYSYFETAVVEAGA